MVKKEAFNLVAILIASLLVSGIGIVGALSFQILIDNLLGTAPESASTSSGESLTAPIESLLDFLAQQSGGGLIATLFTGLLVLYVISSGVQWLRGWLILAMTRRIDRGLLTTYLDHLLRLPVSSIVLRRTGEYLSRIADTSAIRAAVSTTAISLVLDATMVVGGGIVLYLQVGSLFTLALFVVAIQAAIFLLFRQRIESVNREAMESNSMLQSYAKEAIDGVEAIKAANAVGSTSRSMEGKIGKYVDSLFDSGITAISQETLAAAAQTIGTLAILWTGFGLVTLGQISLGSLITFFALLAYFLQPVRNLVDLQPVLQAAAIAADRLNDIQDLPLEAVPERSEDVPTVYGRGVWEVENVTFRYGHNAPVLNDVSLFVRPGERIAIVGESGSGKSTLVKLLLGFFPLQQGTIRVDGVALPDVHLGDLRASIGYVAQNTYLFNDSILNNVRLGFESASESDVREACISSGADDFISSMPMGYSTILDENGGNLSGGQRQRLAIARAFLKDPTLLIFDEATSNLDVATEAGVWDAVKKRASSLACIVISHSLKLVSDCDRIYVMSKGRLVECGNHWELMALDQHYSEMWARSHEPNDA